LAGYAYVVSVAGRVVSEGSGPVPWGFPSRNVGFPPELFQKSVLLAEACALFAFIDNVDVVGTHLRILTSSKRLVEYFTGRRSLPREKNLREIMTTIGWLLNAKLTSRVATLPGREDEIYCALRRRSSSVHDPSRPLGPRSTEIVYISEDRNEHAIGLATEGEKATTESKDDAWLRKFFFRFRDSRRKILP
jgi:hypothetical protein